MADSKCANLDYALDVDSMTLDYILYKAIEGQLRTLALFSAPLSSNDVWPSPYPATRAEARRLVEMFDSLIHLFHLHHPGVELNERVQFSTKILQFLILLYQYCSRSRTLTGTEEIIPEQTIRRLQDETTVNRTFRQHWMKLRLEQETQNADMPTSSESVTKKELIISIADNLMIRFLEFSEELAYGINSNQISNKWVQLAAEFMLQSAIETIIDLDVSQRRFTEGSEWEFVKTRLEECFAWGHINKLRFSDDTNVMLEAIESNGYTMDRNFRTAIEDRGDLEDRISNTLFRQNSFTDSDGDTNIQSQSPGERQQWTTARNEAWQEILLTISSMQEADVSQKMVPVEMLKDSHPFQSFIKHLLDFVEKQWRLVSKSDWYGKPILVQIEEGGIDGMSGEEFQAFKTRVGI